MAQRETHLNRADKNDETFYLRVYFPDPCGPADSCSEENSAKTVLIPDEWNQINITVPDPAALRGGSLRLKPLNTLGFVSISGVKLINTATGLECWSAGEDDSGFSAEKDALVLSGGDCLEIAVTGKDPVLLLPEMPGLPDCPVSLEMWIKVSSNQSGLHRYWEEINVEKKKLGQKKLAFSEIKSILRTKEKELSAARKDLRQKAGSLARLNDQLKEKDQSLQEVRNDLQKQENLTRKYFKALTKAEMERVDFLDQIDTLSAEKKQLVNWMKHLNRQYFSLMNSRRWRLGDAIVKSSGFLIGRRKHAKGVDRMHEIFVDFRKYLKSTNSTGWSVEAGVDGRRFMKFMERLQKDFQLVMDSRSWRLGNGLIHAASRLVMQKRKPTSVIRMKGIFDEFQAWKGNVNAHSLTGQEIKELTRWLDVVEKDFNALFASRRWRLGKALSAPVRFFRRRAKPDVVERVKAVFEEYHG